MGKNQAGMFYVWENDDIMSVSSVYDSTGNHSNALGDLWRNCMRIYDYFLGYLFLQIFVRITTDFSDVL